MVLEHLTHLGEELTPKLYKSLEPGQLWEPSKKNVQVFAPGCGCQKDSAAVILVPVSLGQLLDLSAMEEMQGHVAQIWQEWFPRKENYCESAVSSRNIYCISCLCELFYSSKISCAQKTAKNLGSTKYLSSFSFLVTQSGTIIYIWGIQSAIIISSLQMRKLFRTENLSD